MPLYGPISRNDLIKALRRLGFGGRTLVDVDGLDTSGVLLHVTHNLSCGFPESC
jgi:hypothetical protein